MLSTLLSSKPKTKLVNLFLAHPARSFSPTEIRQLTHISRKQTLATVRELAKIEFILVFEKQEKKYYQINKHYVLYPELVGMLRKLKDSPKDILARQAGRVGNLKFAALTGVFAGRPRMDSDLLFVGRVNPKRLQRFLKLAEKFAEREVGYTVFAPQEFEYRKVMNDRFVKNILENDPVIVVDKTRKPRVGG